MNENARYKVPGISPFVDFFPVPWYKKSKLNTFTHFRKDDDP